MDTPPGVHFAFGGVLGERVDVNVRHWLSTAPDANPGMIEMFRVRDRQPVPQLVPWAGEFVGKYLISAMQTCRITRCEELEDLVRRVVDDLIATQADDGYLGPFPYEERLLGQWDLWGHYYVLQALLMYHDHATYAPARQAALRAADLICRTYLNGTRRVYDAGSHEMNMAVIHIFGRLYRETGEPRYLAMMRHIEQDWQRAGDYLRTGLARVDFHRTPRPRWESLHDLQGLVELYRITGEDDYRSAFLQHWQSLRRLDRHPSGGFSTGEQAVGHPYSLGAVIETCCTIAWMAITVDALRLTADPRAADELELATYNTVLGSQHPSGRWWTYNTPLDGVRRASQHDIVFQARAGTPELNCCSVNASRGLGMLGEWAVMSGDDGFHINHYGPCEIELPLPGGQRLRLVQETAYPADGHVMLTTHLAEPTRLTLHFRIPAWSRHSTVRINGVAVVGVEAGTYLPIDRLWSDGDQAELLLDMSPRYWAGERALAGHACVFHGPLLLSFDQHRNRLDCAAIPATDLERLELTLVQADATDRFAPIVLFDLFVAGGEAIRLCDFATAGAFGNDYRSWLPVCNARPAPFDLTHPPPDGRIAPGLALFEWTGSPSRRSDGRTYELTIAENKSFTDPVFYETGLLQPWHICREGLHPGRTYWWKVLARNPAGVTESQCGGQRFSVDATLSNTVDPTAFDLADGPDQLIIAASLDGTAVPARGRLAKAVDIEPAPDQAGTASGAVAFNGSTSRIVYDIPWFPEDEYTVCAWFWLEDYAPKPYQQIFSAWCGGSDDPLRISIIDRTLSARMEVGPVYATAGVPVESQRWTHVAAVKTGNKLHLYLDGVLAQTADAPPAVYSNARSVGMGCNPNFSGDEFFSGRISDFSFHAKALSVEQIRKEYGNTPQR